MTLRSPSIQWGRPRCPRARAIPTPRTSLVFRGYLPLCLPSLAPTISMRYLSPVLFGALSGEVRYVIS